GRFSFPGLSEGEYAITVSATGFVSFVIRGIQVKHNESYEAEISMLAVMDTNHDPLVRSLDPVETIEVNIVDDPRLLNIRQVTELPVIRHATPLMGLVPGIYKEKAKPRERQ